MEAEFKSKINIKPLDASIQVLASAFDCGNTHIDSFLKGPTALDKGFGKTYVWLDDDDTKILGFYNIGTGSIDCCEGKMRYKLGGSIHINDFALDQKCRGVKIMEGTNMSDVLLEDCIQRILFFRECFAGYTFVTLQSTADGYNLYRRHDFEELEEEMELLKVPEKEKGCTPMYLALDIE